MGRSLEGSRPLTLLVVAASVIVGPVGTSAGRTADSAIAVPSGGDPSQTVAVTVDDPVQVSADLSTVDHAEPHLAVHPSDPNHLLAAAIVLPDSAPHRVDAFLSIDGGATWQRSELSGFRSAETIDPWVAFDPDGVAILTLLVDDHRYFLDGGSTRASVAILSSDDGGRSWNSPRFLPYGQGSSWDAQKAAVDHSDGHHRGRVYVAGTKWGPRTRIGNRWTQALGVFIGDARGFGRLDERHANNLHKTSLQPVVLTDGTLVLLYKEWGLIPNFERTDLLWSEYSTDGGETYSEPTLVSGWVSPGFADVTVSTAGAWSDRIYAAWLEDVESTDARTSAAEFRIAAPRTLKLAVSDELGEHWSSPVDITTSSAGTELVHMRVATDGQGAVAVAWLESVGDENRMCHSWRVRVSTDGGATFTPPTDLGPPACHDLPGDRMMYTMGHQVEAILPRFGRGGDYFGLVGLPSGGFHVVWAASKNGTLQLWSARMRLRE